jgi:glutamine synthetase type III
MKYKNIEQIEKILKIFKDKILDSEKYDEKSKKHYENTSFEHLTTTVDERVSDLIYDYSRDLFDEFEKIKEEEVRQMIEVVTF